jgi:hypothetical protein
MVTQERVTRASRFSVTPRKPIDLSTSVRGGCLAPDNGDTTMRRTLTAVALLSALATAGCGHDPGPKVATARSGAPRVSAAATADGQDSYVAYSRCMRDQGLSWFPDPGADGGLKVSVPDGEQSGFEKADDACKAYVPGANQTGAMSEADLTTLRRKAQCIRDQGFPTYPDPDANGSTQINEEASGISHDDPAFQKAMQECDKYRPARKSRANS